MTLHLIQSMLNLAKHEGLEFKMYTKPGVEGSFVSVGDTTWALINPVTDEQLLDALVCFQSVIHARKGTYK